jgi:hypothetical protein
MINDAFDEKISYSLWSFIGLLVVLLLSQLLDKIWQQVGVGIPFLQTIWVLLFLMLLLACKAGRQHGRWRWLWLKWVGAILILPILVWAFDLSMVRGVQYIAGISLITFAIYFKRRELYQDRIIVIGFLFIAIIACAEIGNIRTGSPQIGPCHLGSYFQQNGCLYSIPTDSAAYLLEDIQNSPNNLIIHDNYNVLTYPLGVSAKLLSAKSIPVGHYFIIMTSPSSLGTASGFITVSQWQFNLFDMSRIFVLEESLVDVREGQVIDTISLPVPSPEEQESIMAQREANEREALQQYGLRDIAYSPDGSWQAHIFDDQRLEFREHAPLEPSLPPFPNVASVLTVPDTPPVWTINAGRGVQCVLFSDDNRYLALFGADELEIYDFASQTIVATHYQEAVHSCPAFSADGQWVVLVDDIEEEKVFIFNRDQNKVVHTLILGKTNVGFVDISADNQYLLMTIDPLSFSQSNSALIFDFHRLVSQS